MLQKIDIQCFMMRTIQKNKKKRDYKLFDFHRKLLPCNLSLVIIGSVMNFIRSDDCEKIEEKKTTKTKNET